MRDQKHLMILSLAFVLLLIFSAEIFAKEIVQSRGGSVKAVKYDDGSWELMVNDAPYFIKGVLYTPVKIGEDPGEASMRDWMTYDDNKDGINDVAYQTWVDENKNSIKDKSERIVGDFKLLQDMGVNTIRLYHIASNNPILGDIYKKNRSTSLQFDHAANKTILRDLYETYGIRVIMGSFLGSWTIGSGASWEEGTDYSNPEHVKALKASIKAMVLDHKDEPYVLMWLLGNENNLGDWLKCNASQDPVAYAKFVNSIAEMIHELDPQHPVAVCDGDNYNTLRAYAKHAPAIDIMAYNSYRGMYGFGNLWEKVKEIFDRPIFLSEFGIFAHNTKKGGEDPELQAIYNLNGWHDIFNNSAASRRTTKQGAGNSIGGVVFDWADRWYLDGSPSIHNPGFDPWSSPDGINHEEWFGIISMGDGSDSLMRQKRKVYYDLQNEWIK